MEPLLKLKKNKYFLINLILLFILNIQITRSLYAVCKKECLNLPEGLAQRIADKCKGNLRRALLMCEACRVQQ